MIPVVIMVIAGIVLFRAALNDYADRVNHPGKAAAAMPNESYWWCPACKCEVDSTRATHEELHDVCGHSVEWREEVKSDD